MENSPIKAIRATIVEQSKPVETKLMVAKELRLLNESTLPAAVKQILIDSLMNEYITESRPVLGASKKRRVECVQKVEERGYVTNPLLGLNLIPLQGVTPKI